MCRAMLDSSPPRNGDTPSTSHKAAAATEMRTGSADRDMHALSLRRLPRCSRDAVHVLEPQDGDELALRPHHVHRGVVGIAAEPVRDDDDAERLQPDLHFILAGGPAEIPACAISAVARAIGGEL